ncbi:MAG: restriction endonuclease [Deltaproteobacteria bacterium]|nr:restriction endonuclease [Deltaproteobacteria bacterium]
MARRSKSGCLGWLVIIGILAAVSESKEILSVIIGCFVVYAVFAVLGPIVDGISNSITRHSIRRKLLRSGLGEADYMSGEEFEQWIAVKMQTLGYEYSLTPGSGDFGADLILRKRREKTVVQAKRWIGPVE